MFVGGDGASLACGEEGWAGKGAPPGGSEGSVDNTEGGDGEPSRISKGGEAIVVVGGGGQDGNPLGKEGRGDGSGHEGSG